MTDIEIALNEGRSIPRAADRYSSIFAQIPGKFSRIKSGQQHMAAGRENFIFFHCPLDGQCH